MDHSALTEQQKAYELKKKLLDCLQQEQKQFSDIAQAFFEKEKLSETDRTALLKTIVEAVDHVLAAGDWNSSLFLRNVVKPLKQIQSEAKETLHLHAENHDHAAYFNVSLSLDEIMVFVLLFQSDGYNINKWAMQLRSLERYVVGRPVYQLEADVEKRIRLRAGSANEAYVGVAILKSEILTSAASSLQKDPYGHVLLLLKETAIKKGRILFFVHQGIHYRFIDGQLIKIESRA